MAKYLLRWWHRNGESRKMELHDEKAKERQLENLKYDLTTAKIEVWKREKTYEAVGIIAESLTPEWEVTPPDVD